MTDHLAALFFSPPARGYTSQGASARGCGGDADLGDRLVPYHETQHVTLTALTACGAALLVAAEMPGWQRLFSQLLDLCRTTHESFATYLSRSVVAIGSGWLGVRLAGITDRHDGRPCTGPDAPMPPAYEAVAPAAST